MLYLRSRAPGAVTAGEILTERRSFVAGQWVEGDESFADRESGRRVHGDGSWAPRLSRRWAGPSPKPAGAFDEGVWADRPVRERAQIVHAAPGPVESAHEPLVATMVAEAGQPVLFAEMAQYAAGIALSRNTIDLFLALAEEEANPVPVDELVRGRVADQRPALRARWGRHGDHARTTGRSSWPSRS